MNMTDPIADMLTRIRNAVSANHESVDVPASRIKCDIARILKEEGYITDYTVSGETAATKTISITLKYGANNQKAITGLKRISKPGLRVYVKNTEVPKVLNGLGIAILSTSKGIMADKEARQQQVGGEVLAYVW